MYSVGNYWTRNTTKMGLSAKKKKDRMKETQTPAREKAKGMSG